MDRPHATSFAEAGTDGILSLKDRQYALTRSLILDAAIAQLEAGELGEVTMRAVSRRAGLAERTMFRHFASRNELLDALAGEVVDRLALPSLPDSADALPEAPRALYRAYEAKTSLTKGALHSELFERIRESVARERWRAVKSLVDEFAPQQPERERTLVAANIRYMLSATTWYYYRFYFRFTLKDSVAAAEQSIRQSLAALRAPGRNREI
jgi:AcrR family transcriptional regulator